MTTNRGAPSKYRPEFAEQLIKHFDRKPYELVLDENGQPMVTVKGQLIKKPCDFPTLNSFATEIGVCSRTIHKWTLAVYPERHEKAGEYKYPEFREAHGLARDYQHKILIQGGLAGVFPGPFAIFAAKNILGWRDKIEHEHSGSIENKLGLSDSLKELLSDLMEKPIEGTVIKENALEHVDVRNVQETSS